MYWFLKGHVAKGYFRDPHSTQKMRPFHSCRLFECTVSIRAKYAALRQVSRIHLSTKLKTYRELTSRCATAHQLATSTKPLSFWNERHPVAFLMNRQVTTVAEHYGIGVLAVAIVANCALCILFFALPCGLSIDRSRTTRSWSMCLRWLWIRFRYALQSLVKMF